MGVIKLLNYTFESSPFGPLSKPGVYLIVLFNPITFHREIVYIGRSRNIRTRLNNTKHPYRVLLNSISDKYVVTYDCYIEDYINVERSLIKLIQPALNIKDK